MSQKRKLQRAADKAKLTAVALNAPPHGCEECRGQKWRTQLTKKLLGELMIGDSTILCVHCGMRWKVSVFTVRPREEVHISFNPIPNEPSN